MRTARLLFLIAALAAAIALPGMTSAAPGGDKILDDQLTGLPASMTGQTLFGVTAGGIAWRLDSGSARLFADGRLQVSVHGLVLAAGANEGLNPIPNAQAILTCAGVPAASSSVVPFSPGGDAQINEVVAVPGHCVAPTVFFAGVPAPGVARWFAVTGW
jgi:hypothetical protein